MASKRVGGCLFANVAAERQLPELTGYRLSRRGAAAALDAGAHLGLPPPGPQSTAMVLYMPPLVSADWQRASEAPLLMRPPTVLSLPLRGYACDYGSLGESGASWERTSGWEVLRSSRAE